MSGGVQQRALRAEAAVPSGQMGADIVAPMRTLHARDRARAQTRRAEAHRGAAYPLRRADAFAAAVASSIDEKK